MLIKYTGSGGLPRSFIEPLQRFVSAGEIVRVNDKLAERLLATGRWRRIEKTGRKAKASRAGKRRVGRQGRSSAAAASRPGDRTGWRTDTTEPTTNSIPEVSK